MNILNEAVPANWPSDAKALVADLRRAYRALEADLSEEAGLALKSALSFQDDEIARECDAYRLCGQHAAIFRLLRERKGRLVPRDVIYSALYGVGAVNVAPKVVDVLICKLRQRLVSVNSPYRIQTQHGLGYRVLHNDDLVQEAGKVEARVHPLLAAKIETFVAQSDIYRLCWAAEMTLTDAAEATGIKPSELHRWVSGYAHMPVSAGQRLANLFKAKQAALLRGANHKPKLAA